MEKIRTHGVKYKLLLIEGTDEEGRANFRGKFNRMRRFLQLMSEELSLEGKVEARVLRGRRMPSISFFNTEGEKGAVTIYYLEELVRATGEPSIAFQVGNETVVSFFRDEFAELWEIGRKVPLGDLLNDDIPDDDFLQDIQAPEMVGEQK